MVPATNKTNPKLPRAMMMVKFTRHKNLKVDDQSI